MAFGTARNGPGLKGYGRGRAGSAPGRARAFPVGRDLLARPNPAAIEAVDKALAAVEGAFPIPHGHRADLPLAVRDLSRLLTRERGQVARSYWAAPRLLSAYLYYFLPWNLFRLAWLLPGLDLPLRPGASVLDLGSGPLTMPLALWCARPDLRARPLDFVCSDVSPKVMEIGRDIFTALAGKESPWSFSLLRAPLDRALKSRGRGSFDCVTAANVLNEASAGRDPEGEHLERRLDELMGMASACLAPEGRLLLLEPGTRLGGKIISLCREGALRRGLAPLAPCTHCRACPMLAETAAAEGRGPRQPSYSGWCHFIHPAAGAPEALLRLAAKARLEKEQLSLSCLLLARDEGGEKTRAGAGRGGSDEPDALDELDELQALYEQIMAGEEDAAPRPLPVKEAGAPDREGREEEASFMSARVVSGPIRLPGREEPGRYVCCAQGLALVPDAGKAPSGAEMAVAASGGERDAKTGALLLRRVHKGRDRAKGTGREGPGLKAPGRGRPRPAPGRGRSGAGRQQGRGPKTGRGGPA